MTAAPKRPKAPGRKSDAQIAEAAPLAAAFWIPIGEIRKWDKNPRKNAKAIPAVMRSIRRFGFVAPVCVWLGQGRLVAGHTRISALASILAEPERRNEAGAIIAGPAFVPKGAPGPGLVPVRMQEFASEDEANAYAIADNKLGELAEDDTEALSALLRGMKSRDATLLAEVGVRDNEMRKLLGEDGGTGGDPGSGRYTEQYGVIVICNNESEQKKVYDQLKALGLVCRVVVT